MSMIQFISYSFIHNLSTILLSYLIILSRNFL